MYARRAEGAADDEFDAAVDARRAALVSVLAELAADYISMRAPRARIAIAQHSIETAREALDLTRTAHARGLATSLATAEAQSELEAAQALLPPLRAELGKLAHAIGVLAGDAPEARQQQPEAAAPAIPVPPAPPLLLPADAIANQPDVALQERKLAAAKARIGVAAAQLYPHFSVPLTLMPRTSYPSETFQAASLVCSAGLSLTQTVYDGGRRSAQVTKARADAQAAPTGWRKSVLNALREVEDALVSLATETERNADLHRAAADSRLAFMRARKLHGAGLTGYLDVLMAERAMDMAADAAALNDGARLRDVIALYKALVGGWQMAEVVK